MDGDTRKSLLVINQFLPSEQGSLWATTKELRDRLVVCGVRRELTLAHVAAALKTSNKELKFSGFGATTKSITLCTTSSLTKDICRTSSDS